MVGDREELKRADRELKNAGPAPIKTREERRFARERSALTSRDKFVDGLLAELIFFGFAAAKGIVSVHGQNSGKMECPLCGSELRFAFAPDNRHFRANCSRSGCISAME